MALAVRICSSCETYCICLMYQPFQRTYLEEEKNSNIIFKAMHKVEYEISGSNERKGEARWQRYQISSMYFENRSHMKFRSSSDALEKSEKTIIESIVGWMHRRK